MPVYEDLIESGGRGSSWAMVAVYVAGFAIIFGVFIVTMVHVMRVF